MNSLALQMNMPVCKKKAYLCKQKSKTIKKI